MSVYSGRTGKVLRQVLGQRPAHQLGLGRVGACGDVNGDGVLDFAASGPGGIGTGGGILHVFSGTGKILHTWRDPGYSAFAFLFVTGVDLDLDGVSDLLAFPSVPTNNSGTVSWFSLRDGSLVTRLAPPSGSMLTSFGNSLAMGRPQPGSPFPVIAVGASDYSHQPNSSPYYLGRLTLLRAAPPGVDNVGAPCAGKMLDNNPRIGLRNLNGKGVRLHVSNLPPGTVTPFLLGLSNTSWGGVKLPLPLDGLGLPGCRLYTSIEVVVFVRTGTRGKDRGYGFVDIPVPLATSNPKLTVYGQWLVAGSGGQLLAGVTGALSWQH